MSYQIFAVIALWAASILLVQRYIWKIDMPRVKRLQAEGRSVRPYSKLLRLLMGAGGPVTVVIIYGGALLLELLKLSWSFAVVVGAVVLKLPEMVAASAVWLKNCGGHSLARFQNQRMRRGMIKRFSKA